ncbi:MAG: UDP-2,3-diacylglucosamine diphosphatase [Myxococcales bacterium]|nr:UDP-2,3-diacylglucosamine diphosphatase [Myxococcales bacterium]
MEIAVISDLHLGARDAADDFGHDDSEFLRFLAHLEQNFERIVLLGDIWETLTGAALGQPLQELRAAQAAHPEIAQRFQLPKYTYVHGNHDLIAGSALGVPEELTLEADGTRILFTHGHHHDLIFQRARWLSELGVWLGAWIRRIGLSPLYRFFQKLDAGRGGVTLDSGACTFQRWAVGVAELRSADIVVTGHTHLATRAQHPGAMFLNSGSCSEGAYSFLSLDTRRSEFAVHQSW